MIMIDWSKVIGVLIGLAVVLIFKVMIFGSLLASAAKGIAGSCGKTYGIESIPIIWGNLFC